MKVKISEKLTAKAVLKHIYKTFLVILGTFIVAFGAAVFLVPFNIVSGGLSGLGIILSRYIPIDIDVIITIFTWLIFFLGLIFLGLKFSINTLISSIVYPIIFSLILRTGISEYILNLLINEGMSVTSNSGVVEIVNLELLQPGRLIIIGLVGGALTGIGCGITFIGGGSTGGLDILAFILNKFTGIKTSNCSLIFDVTIVLVGIIIQLVDQSSYGFLASLIGIFSAVLCSLMIEFVYVRQSGAYFADIVTDKPRELSDRVIKELDRSVTVYNVKGGYSEEDKVCVRIIFARNELINVKDLVADVDKKAFMIIGECSNVAGEGFSKLHSSKDNAIKKIKKLAEDKKEGEEGKNDEPK